MGSPPSYDSHLLKRLNALKKSTISFDATKQSTSTLISAPETDLSARLRSLRNGSLSSPPSSTSKPIYSTPSLERPSIIDEGPDPLITPDQTLDELLAELDLGPKERWSLESDDSDTIKKLLDEAKSTLSPSSRPSPPPSEDKRAPVKDYMTRDLDMSAFALDEDDKEEPEPNTRETSTKHDRLEEESREAQEIVAKLLDEVNLERANENHDTAQEPGGQSEEPEQNFSGPDLGLVLPSALSTLPEPSRSSLDFESDITARLAALNSPKSVVDSLGLPSAPTSAPSSKSGTAKAAPKKFSDVEIESWCIICQDDATVRCAGCGGDLYCANCWKEGHMGPDVGWEERQHRWAAYRKGKV